MPPKADVDRSSLLDLEVDNETRPRLTLPSLTCVWDPCSKRFEKLLHVFDTLTGVSHGALHARPARNKNGGFAARTL